MPSDENELRQKLEALQRRDEVQRSAITSYGIDLGKRRVIDLSFWAPDEQSATRLSEAWQRNEGGVPVVLPPVDGTRSRWLVGVTLTASVDFITTKENAATFLLFADKYDCEYDGWVQRSSRLHKERTRAQPSSNPNWSTD